MKLLLLFLSAPHLLHARARTMWTDIRVRHRARRLPEDQE